jgi:hypothetical protein
MSIAVSRIKSKYKDSFKLEQTIIAIHESPDIPVIQKAKAIASINSTLNMILTDIEIIAYAEKINQDQLDEIFSEMYNIAY